MHFCTFENRIEGEVLRNFLHRWIHMLESHTRRAKRLERSEGGTDKLRSLATRCACHDATLVIKSVSKGARIETSPFIYRTIFIIFYFIIFLFREII